MLAYFSGCKKNQINYTWRGVRNNVVYLVGVGSHPEPKRRIVLFIKPVPFKGEEQILPIFRV